MHPLIAYDTARLRHAELLAEADRRRLTSTADRHGRLTSLPRASSVWTRLRRALRSQTNMTKADEPRASAIALAAAGVDADGRSATTPFGARCGVRVAGRRP